MAGNDKSGRNPTFPLSEIELIKRVEDYKQALRAGEFPRASWPHFAAWLDATEQELADVMAAGAQAGSAYRGRALVLKKMATWMRGQYASASGWSAPAVSSKAIFALKQDVGDGVSWSDGEAGRSGPVEVRVSFGNGDSRGKNAGK